MTERLQQQLRFIQEADKLKTIVRQTYLVDGSRHENDAEHTWELTLMAITLSEYANVAVDLLHVLKILIVHDLVEIYAGDTYAFDEQANEDKWERENEAAQRLFGLLPEDQQTEFMSLWLEYEEQATPEAQFAGALDRLQPLLHNVLTEGKSWQEHGVQSERPLARAKQIRPGSTTLADLAEQLLEEAVAKGYLRR